jgi:hypothetical protein
MKFRRSLLKKKKKSIFRNTELETEYRRDQHNFALHGPGDGQKLRAELRGRCRKLFISAERYSPALNHAKKNSEMPIFQLFKSSHAIELCSCVNDRTSAHRGPFRLFKLKKLRLASLKIGFKGLAKGTSGLSVYENIIAPTRNLN